MIQVHGALKSYSAETTIGPIELEIPGGGITALVGPNGAGKSTLLTMIGRLLTMDGGSIEVGGLDVTTTRSKDLAKILSILRQENHFVMRVTVRQLVGFGRFPHSGGRLTATDVEIVEQAISFLGLTQIADRFIDELSGGQRQRAYVAMVLAQDTRYVLLDEPLNNLDMAHSVQMMQHLRRIATELERTVVIVIHDINFAATYADRIIAMKDGCVAAVGSPEEIIRPEVLSSIFNTPVEVIEGPRGPVAVYF
ncbi:MAG: ATP-binding cassette domain-containing protein [Propionibacteriaceae bacterium]|nr:ATP-binding cassette domain-containing protein [Propionibacteriaceae bacterium]